MITYNNIINAFATFASEHSQINSFGYGSIEDVGATQVKQYPYLFVSPKSSILGDAYATLKFNILLMDKLKEDNTNEQEIHSDVLSIIGDFRSWLDRSSYSEFSVTEQNNIYPFSQRFGDYVAGWTYELELKTEMINGLCNIPGISPFTYDSNGNYINTNYSNLLVNYLPLSGGTMTGCLYGTCARFDSFTGITYYSGSTPLQTVIYNIASQFSGGTGGSGSTYTFSAGTNLTLLTSATNPNVVYSLADSINVPFGISGGTFFQTSVNPNQFLGESIFQNDVHILQPNDLTAYNAFINNIFSTAITTNNIISVSAETDYLTVNNNFTTPVGYVDQLTSYQGNFQYDLSATTYYSGSTPLQDIIYNISSIASSAYTFSAGADNNLYVSRTGNTIEYGMNTAITVNSIYSLFHYNYGDFNNQGNFANVGTITTTELLSVNGLSGDSIFSGSSNLNQVFAGINHTHNFSAITNTAHTHNISDVTNLQSELNTKANLSGANFTVLSSSTIFSGSSELSTLFPYDVSKYRTIGTTTLERWYCSATVNSTLNSATLTTNVLRFVPFIISNRTTVDRIGIEVAVSGSTASNARLGIYDVSGGTIPNNLVEDFGTVDISLAGAKSININRTLNAGLYYLVMVHNSAVAPQFRIIAAGQGNNILGSPSTLGTGIGNVITSSFSYAALPNNCSGLTLTVATTSAPAIYLRFSA